MRRAELIEAVWPVARKESEGEAKAFFSTVNTNGDNLIPDLRAGLRYKIGPLGLRAGYRYLRVLN